MPIYMDHFPKKGLSKCAFLERYGLNIVSRDSSLT
jgi:hypothetical protein